MKRSIAFIVNPISGTGNKNNIPHYIEQNIDKSLVDYKVYFTEYSGHAKVLTSDLVKKGIDIVVAVGGDGTVNEVASSLVHSTASLGIIPSGSGNGLARHLGIPLNAPKAIKLLNQTESSIIDYGKINDDKLFFCSCGVGFDALVSWRFAQANKRGLITYCNIAIRENFYYKPETYIITTKEGVVLKDRAFVIACGNAAQYGNDAFIAPHASIQDGLLDVTLIEPINFVDTPVLAYQLFAKSIDGNRKTKTLRSQKVNISRDGDGPMHYDGEPFMAPRELSIEIIKGGLKVIANTSQLV